ncbi:MAG: LSM domain-containing protein [Candidatus Methanofastidiosia archaeon]
MSNDELEKPLDLIHKSLETKVSVILKDGREVRGKLIGYDTEFNISLSGAEIYDEESKRRLGKVVIRHNNLYSITPIL